MNRAIPAWAALRRASGRLLNSNNTVSAYRIIYLQRLADPTRPYVADTTPGSTPQQWNPYRTIDAMTVDLTTFNGVTSDVDPTLSANGVWHFEARQRGEKNYLPGNAPAAAGGVGEVNLWKQEPASKAKAGVGWIGGGATATGSMYFNQPLNQTLGYLNKPYGPPSNPPTTGDSQYPFPWLNYSYRPFNNVYELMLVPTVSSSKLLARNTVDPRRYFQYVDGAVRAAINGGQFQNVYDPPVAQPSNQVPFPHLLNFFESTQSSKTGAGFGRNCTAYSTMWACRRDSTMRSFKSAPTWPRGRQPFLPYAVQSD